MKRDILDGFLQAIGAAFKGVVHLGGDDDARQLGMLVIGGAILAIAIAVIAWQLLRRRQRP